MTMKQYSYAMKLDVNAPSIRYSDFLTVKRLNRLSIIDEFITADKQNAINKLKESIKKASQKITFAVIGFVVIFVSFWLIKLLETVLGVEIF